MNMQSKQWIPDAMGACAGVAGLALLGVVAASGDAIGHSVVAIIGGGLAFGVLGCIWKEIVTRRSDLRRGALRTLSAPSYAAVSASIVSMPPFADATASEFDESKEASFASVVSLTEAQVERQRERQRQAHRATLNRA
jgi:hypothetical protein